MHNPQQKESIWVGACVTVLFGAHLRLGRSAKVEGNVPVRAFALLYSFMGKHTKQTPTVVRPMVGWEGAARRGTCDMQPMHRSCLSPIQPTLPPYYPRTQNTRRNSHT